jgi:phosphatidate phosphatase APP1
MTTEPDPEPRRRRPLHEAAFRLDQLLDATRLKRRGDPERITVEPYLAHGSRDLVIARGRVFEDAPIAPAVAVEPLVHRFRRSLRRFVTNELGGIEIEARLGESTGRAVTDAEGYYEIELAEPDLPGDRLLHDMDISVVVHPDAQVSIGTARAHVPTLDARRIVISDIDDTVLATDATRTLRMLATTLVGSALTRRSFPGTPQLYEGFARGAGGEDNAFVYVSSSPWNLHGFLEAFLRHTGLPVGPLFLRDFGVDEDKFISGTHDDHKQKTIESLLALHDQPFALIGDTGQHDPEIYRAVALSVPSRIDGIFLRHVAGDQRAVDVDSLFGDVVPPMAIGADSAELALAAEAAHLIPPGWSAQVAAASDPRV